MDDASTAAAAGDPADGIFDMPDPMEVEALDPAFRDEALSSIREFYNYRRSGSSTAARSSTGSSSRRRSFSGSSSSTCICCTSTQFARSGRPRRAVRPRADESPSRICHRCAYRKLHPQVRLPPSADLGSENHGQRQDRVPALVGGRRLAGVLLEAQRAHTEAVSRERGAIVPLVFHRDGEPIKDFRGAWATPARPRAARGGSRTTSGGSRCGTSSRPGP